MCFSASASFGAGVVLSTIGIITFKKTEAKSQLVFASIPFIFAVQQISEGFLWLALANPSYAFLEKFTSHAFVFFLPKWSGRFLFHWVCSYLTKKTKFKNYFW